jgi:hypothetical protein
VTTKPCTENERDNEERDDAEDDVIGDKHDYLKWLGGHQPRNDCESAVANDGEQGGIRLR